MKLSTRDVGLQRRQHVQVARPDIRLNENIIHMSIMAKFNFVQYLLKEFGETGWFKNSFNKYHCLGYFWSVLEQLNCLNIFIVFHYLGQKMNRVMKIQCILTNMRLTWSSWVVFLGRSCNLTFLTFKIFFFIYHRKRVTLLLRQNLGV